MLDNFDNTVDFLKNKYKLTKYSIIINNYTVDGFLCGNDECFNFNKFYQFFIDFENKKLYYAYYNIPEGVDDLGAIDYTAPEELEEIIF